MAIILTAADARRRCMTLLGAHQGRGGRPPGARRAARRGAQAAVASAVWDGKVAVATDRQGDRRRQARDGKHLTDTRQLAMSVGNHPDLLSSLLFLDFSRLLTLGEETGLSASSAYRSAKADLQKVRAIGASTSGNSSESTAEISLLITP